MFKDLIELEFTYLRHRYVRIKKFSDKINNMTSIQRESQEDQLRNEFLRINKNYLTPGHNISENNSFYKIIDYNKKGSDIFNGVLPEEC